MNKIVALLLLVFATCEIIYSQQINAVFHYAPFSVPDQKPYLETYIAIFGKSVHYAKMPEGKLLARVEVTMTLSDGDSIVAFKKYVLENTMSDDTSGKPANFIDVQRMAVDHGVYSFGLTLKDLNRMDTSVLSHSEIIAIDFSDSVPVFSGIEPVERIQPTESNGLLVKSGMEIIPYVSSFYPKNMEKISFYSELYGIEKAAGEGNEFLLVYYLEENITRVRLAEFSRFKKMKADRVVSFAGELGIKMLPSGTYLLVLEARDRNNKILAVRKTLIQRSNPGMEAPSDYEPMANNSDNFFKEITNIDTLRFHIMSVYPVAGMVERQHAENLLPNKDIAMMQNYLYQFWLSRDPENPRKSWEIYLKQVYLVNTLYSAGAGRKRYGFETDRGRVYLQYGAPNSIVSRNMQAGIFPYEIWHYYSTPKQSDVRFIFYISNIGGADYVLLHSNAIGEIHEPAWKILLEQRTHPEDPDAVSGSDMHGDHRDEDWGNTKNKKDNN